VASLAPDRSAVRPQDNMRSPAFTASAGGGASLVPNPRQQLAFAICEEMALPREVRVSRQNNALGRPTPQSPAIENIGLFRALSNRVDPPPERETAAPVGAGNGGNKHENRGGAFKDRTYRA